MVTNPILHNFRDISQNSVIMAVKKQIWPPWAYMLALLSFLSAPSLKEVFELRYCSSYSSNCVYIQDDWQAALLKLDDIKNLFEVHNPQTIPDLGVKFQTI